MTRRQFHVALAVLAVGGVVGGHYAGAQNQSPTPTEDAVLLASDYSVLGLRGLSSIGVLVEASPDGRTAKALRAIGISKEELERALESAVVDAIRDTHTVQVLTLEDWRAGMSDAEFQAVAEEHDMMDNRALPIVVENLPYMYVVTTLLGDDVVLWALDIHMSRRAYIPPSNDHPWIRVPASTWWKGAQGLAVPGDCVQEASDAIREVILSGFAADYLADQHVQQNPNDIPHQTPPEVHMSSTVQGFDASAVDQAMLPAFNGFMSALAADDPNAMLQFVSPALKQTWGPDMWTVSRGWEHVTYMLITLDQPDLAHVNFAITEVIRSADSGEERTLTWVVRMVRGALGWAVDDFGQPED